MKDVPKQANDAMALSMIVGYPGNIHANGEIIIQVWHYNGMLQSLGPPSLPLLSTSPLLLQDEFVVYEKSRWTGGAKRQLFLLDRVIIITKEKDNDGLYVFKDSLKVCTLYYMLIALCIYCLLCVCRYTIYLYQN